ncbi:MAG: hypothetical protein ACSHX4_10200 [Opitutaceae bacterium]
MKVVYPLFLLLFCLVCPVSALTQGMTPKQVERELGKPISELSAGGKTIYNYEKEGQLVFMNGALVSADGISLPAPASKVEAPAVVTESAPILKVDLPVMRSVQTIGETTLNEDTSMESLEEGYKYSQMADELEHSINRYDSEPDNVPESENERLINILIGFIIEVVITLIVLKIAFSMSGFPALWRQLVLLSMAVALGGAIVDYIIHAGIFSPVRNGLSFILLLLLIRQMTDVREWATAIKIAITARLVSIAVMWLAFAGLLMLFGSLF